MNEIGPLIRYVLNKEVYFHEHFDRMLEVVANFDLSDAVINFLSGGFIPINREIAKLFLIEANEDYSKPSRIKWASDSSSSRKLY